MSIQNYVYDWVKVIGQIILPELVAFILVVLNAKHISTEDIAPVLAKFIVLWNAFVMGWNKVYHDHLTEEAQEETELPNDFEASDPNEGIG